MDIFSFCHSSGCLAIYGGSPLFCCSAPQALRSPEKS
jgi:hypothetical protein